MAVHALEAAFFKAIFKWDLAPRTSTSGQPAAGGSPTLALGAIDAIPSKVSQDSRKHRAHVYRFEAYNEFSLWKGSTRPICGASPALY
jgi:hypothetical protein